VRSGIARTWRRNRLPIPREYRSIEIGARTNPKDKVRGVELSAIHHAPVTPPRAASRYYCYYCYHYHYFGSTVIALSAASMSLGVLGAYSLRVKAARHTCAISPLSRCTHILSRSIGERARPLADIQFSAALARLGAPPSARERERNRKRERERERSSVSAEKLSSAPSAESRKLDGREARDIRFLQSTSRRRTPAGPALTAIPRRAFSAEISPEALAFRSVGRVNEISRATHMQRERMRGEEWEGDRARFSARGGKVVGRAYARDR